MKSGKLIQSSVMLVTAGLLMKFGNENYEQLKAAGTILLPIACLIGAIALMIVGIKTFSGAFAKN